VEQRLDTCKVTKLLQLTMSWALGQVVDILGRYIEQVEVVTDPNNQDGVGIWLCAKMVAVHIRNTAQHRAEDKELSV